MSMQLSHGPAALAAALAISVTWLGCGGEATTGSGSGAGGGSGADLSALPQCTADDQPEPPHVDIEGAVYSVPVSADLAPYASYPVGDVSLCRSSVSLELGYSLPALLVGKKTRVSFAGALDDATGAYELSSEDGTARCERIDGAWSCLEHFTGIEVDLEEVAEEAESLDAAETAARLEVAEIFQGDPIGVLDFALP